MTDQQLMNEVRGILRHVRRMEKAEAMRRGQTLQDAYLSCDTVAEMALPLLRAKGFLAEVVVGNVRGHPETHAWLETASLIIDPTADQFRLRKVRRKSKKRKLYLPLP